MTYLRKFVSSEFIFVEAANDLPAPVNGVITLAGVGTIRREKVSSHEGGN